MKNKLTFVFLSLYLLLSSSLFAQHQDWTGQVWDSKNNEPLIGVSIMVKGTNIGTITDTNGRFSIKASVNQVLIFKYIGYTPLEVQLKTKESTARLIMSEDVRTLDEVVVVGYGVQKKVSSVGSISSAKGEDILKAGSVTTVSEALQGMLPGVVAIMADSKPGSDAAQIIIRGKSSWASSQPLVMVDGIERDMNDVDPNEIESVSVLKDASATAVYGVKGANGVILVTTKRGSNQKPSISVSSNFGFKQPLNSPKYADNVTGMKMWNEALTNDLKYSGLIPESTISAWENAYATGNTGKYNPYFPNVDWWDEMVKDFGYQQQYNINISGGSEFMKYFASVGYLNDGDIFKTQKNELFDPTFKYQRYNWRSNLDFQLTKTTVLSINLSGKQGYRSQTGYRMNDEGNDGDDNYGQPQFFQTLYNAPRNVFPITWPDGTYGVGSAGGSNLALLFDKGQRIYKYYQNFIDANFKQDLNFITKGLTFNTKFGYNATSNTRSDILRYQGGTLGGPFGEKSYIAYYRQYDYSKPLGDGTYALSQERRWTDNYFQGDHPSVSYDQTLNGGFGKRLYYEFAFNYNRSFGNHNITALALMNRNEIEGLDSGSATTMQFEENDESWVSRLTYNWKERYLAEFNGAYSGSQKFAPGMRYQFFPSYSIGWRISEEPFIKKIAGKIIDNLKVRFSSGVVGYDRIPGNDYAYIQSYNSSGSVSFGENEKVVYGPLYVEGTAANVNATWETAYKKNLGIDLLLLNKLSTTVDLYSENREGMLMEVSLPGYFGIKAAKANIGRTKSRGIEAEIGWNDKIGKNFSYWLKVNYAINENRVVFKDDAISLDDYLKAEGKPIGYATKLQTTGYYQSLDDIFNNPVANNVSTQSKLVPGDLMYLDYNADGVIDNINDKIPMKYSSYPQNTFGATLGFRYKQFQVNGMIYGVVNVYKDVDGNILWDLADGNQGSYQANPDVIGRWTVDNAENALKPALHSDYRSYSMVGGTTYTYQNASYVRLKNLELSYDFKSKVLKKAGIKSLQIYSSANNLFTITRFNKQIDPEGNSASLYPLVRRYNIGTRISF